MAAADPRHTLALREAWAELGSSRGPLATSELGLGELPPGRVGVEGLCRWLELSAEVREEAHLRVFGLLVSKQCPPCETEYSHWKDPTYRAHQMADIAGFYHAFGVEPDGAHPERPDHVSLELEFVSLLLLKLDQPGSDDAEARTITRGALHGFIRDHVVWWMPTFARCVERQIEIVLRADASPQLRQSLGAFGGVLTALRAWVAAAREFAGVEPSRRIIAPQVDPDPVGDDCERCSTC